MHQRDVDGGVAAGAADAGHQRDVDGGVAAAGAAAAGGGAAAAGAAGGGAAACHTVAVSAETWGRHEADFEQSGHSQLLCNKQRDR